MDIFGLLSYINKVSLLAFFITTAVVGYQIYALRKEKSKERKPSIPDFKDLAKSGQSINYTILPDMLTKKETKLVNYSNLVFLIISLLTVVVVTFIIILIKKNSTPTINQATKLTNNQKKNVALNNKPPFSPTPSPSPTPSLFPTPSLVPTLMVSPVLSVTPSPTFFPSPTEIILANPSPIETAGQNSTESPVLSKLQSLPVTGSVGKGLILFGTAITTIILSFWL